nr:twin-arginine translocation pathway signal [Mycobacterium heckeshornense]
MVIAAAGLAAGLFFIQYRADRQIDDAAKQQAIHAASDGAVAVLSYSANNLNRDFDKARSHLTGDFLTYYTKFTEQIVAPAAQRMQLTQTAKVVRAAVSDLQPNSASVLVFLDQTTLSKEKPKPLVSPSGVRVTLSKVNGSWLIAKFDPL